MKYRNFSSFLRGGLMKAQEGLNGVLPQHQQMYSEELAKKRKWYEGRLKHENPKIREDAQTALDLIGKFPETVPSDMVEYKPFFNLYLKGALGRFNPFENKIELADPNRLFPEKLPIGSKRFKEDTKDRKDLERAYELSQGPYVQRHEWEHLTDFPILQNIIKKQNKDIYKQYVPLKEYYGLHKKDFINPSPRGALSDATSDYYWATGIPSFKQIGVSDVKHMNNAEMFRALNDARRIFGIDPSRNSNPEEWQNIFEKSRQKLFDKNISEEERMQYNHILELFRTRGNDINKVNDLNNMIVSNDKSPLSNFMRRGGQMIKRADGSYSRRGLWDNIRANRGSGKKPTSEMLEQERKIRRESKEIGGIFMGQKLFRPRKSSIFANGGMTARQFYNFLFDGDDDYNDETAQVVKKNTAPSESELKELKQQNEDLLFKLEQANMRNASFDVINAPSTIDPSSSYTSPDYSQFYNIGTSENQTFPSFGNRSPNMIPSKSQVWGQVPSYLNNTKGTNLSNITKIYGFAE